MKWFTAPLLALLTLGLVSFSSTAQVTRTQLTSGIVEREPVDDLANTLAVDGSDVQTVYFFTHVEGFAGKQIIHRWFYNGREMAAVTLNIGSQDWRTYSSKRLMPAWQGEWQVQVWHQDLQLTSHTFQYGTQ